MSGKIRVCNLKNVVLMKKNYDYYRRQHFTIPPISLLIEKNVSFSNQREELHNELRKIKDIKNYSNDFFVVAQRYTNIEKKSSASSLMDESLINQDCSQPCVKSKASSSTLSLIETPSRGSSVNFEEINIPGKHSNNSTESLTNQPDLSIIQA
ncbi:40_t:CDS:2 [Gigaspora margarita]|uniref:40_t:CDS:1 n=1 Tax=Gigaspora margarita TaxID=4874 RepID=A0ABN7UJT6_GIGMA|nr:40_t:CDS:2 [Gigaspora margarita]